jgi:hypothetical protein
LTAPIGAGASRDIPSIPPGAYDLRAESTDGRFLEVYAVTVAAGRIFTLTISPDAPVAAYLDTASAAPGDIDSTTHTWQEVIPGEVDAGR